MNPVRRIALKVDCDTYQGTKNGIPTLLRIFSELGIKASFFFTLGPDRSGRAIRRVFTQKGFLKKMLRSNAASLYGPKTMLYGTLLPAPFIGKELKEVIRSVHEAGHEVGVHGWDHVRWHDCVHRLSEEAIRKDYGQAHEVFQSIFGFKAHSSAAPGWHATPDTLAVQEGFDLLYTSDTRGGAPYFPRVGTHVMNFLEIPTTLPTWDESLANQRIESHEELINFYEDAVNGTEVHTIHTEVEGMKYAPLFEKLIQVWQHSGSSFLTLRELANENLKNKLELPSLETRRVSIPNRAGLVSNGSQ